ncbi:hypothetical protein OPU71_20845 [Niveibacterium sp. 24ML]|nr:hypothetical protein [Niveibacterium sp. 24ML]
MLAFSYIQQDIHDMPVAFMWLMILLSFPTGALGAALVGIVWPPLSSFFGFEYQPFLDLLPYWVALAGLGYLQWFVAVPWLFRKVRALRGRA